MNGAKADPSVRMIRAPSRTSRMMIGVSHHFLRVLKNAQNSLRIESFAINTTS